MKKVAEKKNSRHKPVVLKSPPLDAFDFEGTASNGLELALKIKTWARELGFVDCRIADLDLTDAQTRWRESMARAWYGDMHYLERGTELRLHPERLLPGAVRVLSFALPYLANNVAWIEAEEQRLQQPEMAVVSTYARGRDYHKVMRALLKKLAQKIAHEVPHRYRVFADSAPLMEVELAAKAGLGWRGKNTLLLNRHAGSMFFLGELLTDLPLPVDEATTTHCGECRACLDLCPTQAITAPYQLDARRCISYLTIELHGSIARELRPLIGNRIYGCDDCQLVCPWNKFAQRAVLPDFAVRHPLGDADLLTLWHWTEADFLRHTEGSAIRRIGHLRWRRNLAVALGNALRSASLKNDLKKSIRAALQAALPQAAPLLAEHVEWALEAE